MTVSILVWSAVGVKVVSAGIALPAGTVVVALSANAGPAAPAKRSGNVAVVVVLGSGAPMARSRVAKRKSSAGETEETQLEPLGQETGADPSSRMPSVR